MTPSMETIAPTIIFRMGHSLVLLNGRTAVSVPDNLALALRRLNQGSPQIDVVQVRAVPIVTDLSKHQSRTSAVVMGSLRHLDRMASCELEAAVLLGIVDYVASHA